MNLIDITITRGCTTCRTETNLRYHSGFLALGDSGGMDCRIDPDEFSVCPTCGNPQQLIIKSHPYDLANHRFESPLHNAVYEQQLREEEQTAH